MSTSERPNELGAAVYGGVKKMSRCFGLADSPPCITARRGGRAINKMPRSVRDREAGVVFRLRTKRKTTPAASVSVASLRSIDDAATPPCGDARRGMFRSHTFSTFFSQLL